LITRKMFWALPFMAMARWKYSSHTNVALSSNTMLTRGGLRQDLVDVEGWKGEMVRYASVRPEQITHYPIHEPEIPEPIPVPWPRIPDHKFG
jgi:hypothetical protein